MNINSYAEILELDADTNVEFFNTLSVKSFAYLIPLNVGPNWDVVACDGYS